jgi:hypothetical protein
VGSVDNQSLQGSSVGINVNLSWYLRRHIGLQIDGKSLFSEVDAAGRQSGAYAVIGKLNQGLKAGKSTSCTTNFMIQDAGARS